MRQAIADRNESAQHPAAIAWAARRDHEAIEEALRNEVACDRSIPTRVVGDEERTRGLERRQGVLLRRSRKNDIARERCKRWVAKDFTRSHPALDVAGRNQYDIG